MCLIEERKGVEEKRVLTIASWEDRLFSLLSELQYDRIMTIISEGISVKANVTTFVLK